MVVAGTAVAKTAYQVSARRDNEPTERARGEPRTEMSAEDLRRLPPDARGGKGLYVAADESRRAALSVGFVALDTALDTAVMAGRQSWPGELFRLDPAGATTLAAMAVLHITDIHADPFYNVSWYGCGNKGCTRNLTLQDNGQPTQNLCNASAELVAGECGPYEEISRWPETVALGPLCPCGVSYSDPPYSVMPPLRAALEEFANDGFAAQAAIYTGDLAGYYMPGASAKLEHRCCPCCLEHC